MQQYIMRRILLAIPTLFGVSLLIFLVMRVLPGGPLQAMADEESGPTSYTEEQKEAILRSLGLDRPLYQQYLITVSGLQFANLLGGSVAVERAFSAPGLGAALAQAMNGRDWMVMQNLVLLFAVIFVVINLIVDLTYALIDPRIRFR